MDTWHVLYCGRHMCAYSLRACRAAGDDHEKDASRSASKPCSNSKEATVTVQKNLPKRDHAPNAPCAYCWWGRPRASGTLVSRGPAAAMSGGSGRLPTGPPDMRGAPLGAERLTCGKCLVFRSESRLPYLTAHQALGHPWPTIKPITESLTYWQ